MKSLIPIFSILNLLLLAFAVAASVAAYRYRTELRKTETELAAVEAELGEARPIPFSSVQFQIQMATQDFASTEVGGIKYDPYRDQYSVQFGWTDRKTGKRYDTGITFLPDGAGRYSGRLLNEPFATNEYRSDGSFHTIPYTITIKDPTTRINDILVEAGSAPIQDEDWRRQN